MLLNFDITMLRNLAESRITIYDVKIARICIKTALTLLLGGRRKFSIILIFVISGHGMFV